jgi:hypothetical protein
MHHCNGAKLARAPFLVNSVKWQYFLHGRCELSAGAPGEIRTPDPQIRSEIQQNIYLKNSEQVLTCPMTNSYENKFENDMHLSELYTKYGLQKLI